MKIIVGLSLIVALFLVGCGSEGTGHNYETEYIYRGDILHCIVFDGRSYGHSSGVSCDFVRFYNEK